MKEKMLCKTMTAAVIASLLLFARYSLKSQVNSILVSTAVLHVTSWNKCTSTRSPMFSVLTTSLPTSTNYNAA